MNIKSDYKPPSSPPPKEDERTVKNSTNRDKEKKRESPKGIDKNGKENQPEGIRRRKNTYTVRGGEQTPIQSKKLPIPEPITNEPNMQIKPMQDEVSIMTRIVALSVANRIYRTWFLYDLVDNMCLFFYME